VKKKTPPSKWGVKCLTDIGWYGKKKPNEYTTKAEAQKVAAQLNADQTNLETWEARALPE